MNISQDLLNIHRVLAVHRGIFNSWSEIFSVFNKIFCKGDNKLWGQCLPPSLLLKFTNNRQSNQHVIQFCLKLIITCPVLSPLEGGAETDHENIIPGILTFRSRHSTQSIEYSAGICLWVLSFCSDFVEVQTTQGVYNLTAAIKRLH